MAAVADSDQGALPVGFPGGFTPLPGRGAPRLRVFQRRKFHLESRPDDLSEVVQAFIQVFLSSPRYSSHTWTRQFAGTLQSRRSPALIESQFFVQVDSFFMSDYKF